MAAGGHCGDAVGGCSLEQRYAMVKISTPPVYLPLGCSWSSKAKGGCTAARPAASRCAHGRLAQRLRARRAVDTMRVVRKWYDGRRMTATVVLQPAMAAAAAARRPEHAYLGPEGLHVATSATHSSGGKLATSKSKCACLRARCERAMCEMGPCNAVQYVGTKAPGSPGFS